jgi:hypothetical protein
MAASRALRSARFALSGVLVVLGVLILSSSVAGASTTDEERWVFCKINDERRSRGLAPAAYDATLSASSRSWSATMRSDGVLRHDPNLVAALDQADPRWTSGGENVGVGSDHVTLHAAFMASTGHRDNLLSARNRLGVGVVTGADGRHWVTHRLMAAPAPADPDTCPEGAAPTPAQQATMASPTGFGDVPRDAYYEDPVLWAVERGVTSGCTGTRFCPNADVTRGQVATFQWRVAGQPSSSAPQFLDVPSTAHFATPVRWMRQIALTSGCGGERYCPADSTTRAQMVTLLWRFAGSPDRGTAHGFADVPRGAYYEAAVTWAAHQGITTGSSPTTFAPHARVTRAQMVTFLHRYVTDESAAGDGAVAIAVR